VLLAPGMLHLQSVSTEQRPGSPETAGTHITPEVAPDGGLQWGMDVVHQLHTSPPQTLPPPPVQSLSTMQAPAPASPAPPLSGVLASSAVPASVVPASDPASVPASWASAAALQQSEPDAPAANDTTITLHFMIISLRSKGLRAAPYHRPRPRPTLSDDTGGLLSTAYGCLYVSKPRATRAGLGKVPARTARRPPNRHLSRSFRFSTGRARVRAGSRQRRRASSPARPSPRSSPSSALA